MTVHQKIRNALNGFGIPVKEDLYDGGEKEYFTFHIVLDEATMYADDEPLQDVAHIQVHWILPVEKDYLSGKKAIRKKLYEGGFTYPEVDGFVEPDNKTRHIVFDCDVENEEELED